MYPLSFRSHVEFPSILPSNIRRISSPSQICIRQPLKFPLKSAITQGRREFLAAVKSVPEPDNSNIPPPASPTDLVQWGGTLPPTRRLISGTLAALLISLGANFLGSTSFLLGFIPQAARKQKIDLIFPVNGFRRCIENNTGFEFLYPEDWVGDQTLLYRAAERAERERSLDLPQLRSSRRRSSTEPLVAFGPPGSEGELNVSVVVAPVPSGFRLEAFGAPVDVANRILKNVIAPEGSGKEAVLFSASQRKSGQVLYYTLEFSVRGSEFYRHNLAVYAAYNGLLYSLNAQCAEGTWNAFAGQFKIVADSFEVTAAGAGQAASVVPSLL